MPLRTRTWSLPPLARPLALARPRLATPLDRVVFPRFGGIAAYLVRLGYFFGSHIPIQIQVRHSRLPDALRLSLLVLSPLFFAATLPFPA